MIKNRGEAYERYLNGIELQEKGKTGDEIAKALGLKDAQAWYTTRHYYSSKKLAERTAPTTPDNAEPAAILEGLDCERTAPRPMLNAKGAESEGSSAIREIAEMITQQSVEELHRLGYITPNQAKSALMPDGMQAAPAPRRLAVTQLICAEGEKVRYRLHDGMVFINSKGQKKCALRLTVDEMKVMIAELGDFLMEANV